MAQTGADRSSRSGLPEASRDNSAARGWFRSRLWRLRLARLNRLSSWFMRRMPSGLYARALIIIIAPVVLLQSIIAFVFMERHWEQVTQRLSSAVTQDIAAVIDVIETYPQDDIEQPDYSEITRIANERLNLSVTVLPPEPLPAPAPKPFFNILDAALSEEIRKQINRPFWIDTVGNSNLVEIRVQLEEGVLRVLARRSHTYASNSHIFLLWMVGSSLVLLAIAILFLRNQITPILRLSREMEGFGKGQGISPRFTPRGAREVRLAARQFITMGDRIERQMEQRTDMLAGVSHDLRTVLTRFKLQLALLGRGAEVRELEDDVGEMQSMLQGYLDFVRGHGEEPAEETELYPLLGKFQSDARLKRKVLHLEADQDLVAVVRPQAFQRLMTNLVSNALRHGDMARIRAFKEDSSLQVYIDDDGPGIPPDARSDVFKPFNRLDAARNLDETGTGLGLSIARDIARGHGGDIELATSDLGGLSARINLPL